MERTNRKRTNKRRLNRKKEVEKKKNCIDFFDLDMCIDKTMLNYDNNSTEVRGVSGRWVSYDLIVRIMVV